MQLWNLDRMPTAVTWRFWQVHRAGELGKKTWIWSTTKPAKSLLWYSQARCTTYGVKSGNGHWCGQWEPQEALQCWLQGWERGLSILRKVGEILRFFLFLHFLMSQTTVTCRCLKALREKKLHLWLVCFLFVFFHCLDQEAVHGKCTTERDK